MARPHLERKYNHKNGVFQSRIHFFLFCLQCSLKKGWCTTRLNRLIWKLHILYLWSNCLPQYPPSYNNTFTCSSLASLSLPTLCNELGLLKYKAQEIGILLGISLGKLKEMKQDGDLFLESLDYWLRGNTDVPVTWGSIVAALESDFVNELGCAKKIKRKYCQSEEDQEVNGEKY